MRRANASSEIFNGLQFHDPSLRMLWISRQHPFNCRHDTWIKRLRLRQEIVEHASLISENGDFEEQNVQAFRKTSQYQFHAGRLTNLIAQGVYPHRLTD